MLTGNLSLIFKELHQIFNQELQAYNSVTHEVYDTL